MMPLADYLNILEPVVLPKEELEMKAKQLAQNHFKYNKYDFTNANKVARFMLFKAQAYADLVRAHNW